MGDLPARVYRKVDCDFFRFKALNYSFHKESMDGGACDIHERIGDNRNWKQPTPNS